MNQLLTKISDRLARIPLRTKIAPAIVGTLLAAHGSVSGQAFDLSTGNYSQQFADIGSTTAWVTPATGAFTAVAVGGTTTIPDANKITAASTAFTTGSTGGVQRGTENILFLSTGAAPGSTSSTALDLNLNATNRSLGTLSFNAATVFNSTGDRVGTLKVYGSTDGAAWTEVTGTNLPYTATNNVAGSAAVSATLPSSLNGSATVKLRFYYFNGPTNGTSGSRPKISVDDLVVTSTSLTTDVTNPTVAAVNPFSPADGATGVALSPTLSITFSEPVVAGTGGISIFTGAGVQVGTTIPAASLISGAAMTTVSFAPTVSLTESENYYVLVDSTAFKDTANLPFAGISLATTWNFNAVGPDTAGPVAVSYDPASGSTTATANDLFDALITFNEAATTSENPVITLENSSGTVIETLDPSLIIPGPGNLTAALFFDSVLEYSQTYTIKVAAGSFLDNATPANPSLAFQWTFTAQPEPPSVPLGLTTVYTQDFSTFGPESATSTAPVLPVGWSLKGAVTTFNADVAQRSFGTGVGAGLRGVLGENVLGYQHTGSTGTDALPTFDEILTLKNTTGGPITNLVVGYTGKIARATEGRSPIFTVTVAGVTVPALQYSTAAGVESILQAGVTGLSIPDGALFQIVWSSDRGLPSGSSRQIGLTNVSVKIGDVALPPAVTGPTLVLAALSDVGASVTTNVSSENGNATTQRGIVFAPTATNANPLLGGAGVTSVTDGAVGTGDFTSVLSGLTPSTSYSVKGFATNANGTGYTSVLTFTTLAPPPSFTGSYSEPFDAYNGTWPVGWTAISSGGVQTFNALDWTSGSTNGGFYGGRSDPGLIGYLHTGASLNLTLTLSLVNNTGAPLTQLFVSYLGQTGNTAATRFPVCTVSIDGTPVPALEYSTADGIDKNVGALVTGLNIPAGATFKITWVSNRGDNAGGSSRKIGIGEVAIALDGTPPPVGGYSSWATTNAGGQAASLDFDGDGVANGVEYFFGATGSSFTPNPSVVAGKITWPMSATATGVTYKVQTSTTLASGGWTDVAQSGLVVTAGTPTGTVAYTLPTSGPKLFVRLVVTAP